ncbi:MAG: DUF1622 domain-containing protein [Acidimicrobiales bacterium]
MALEHVVDPVGAALEIVGVAIVAGGTLLSLAAMSVRWFRQQRSRPAGASELGDDDRNGQGSRNLYVEGRRSVGRSILLGIEVLVAGDIIRTVAVSPSFTSVGVLAGIVAIRTFLSFTLEVEITGQWPWQQEPRESASSEI